METTRTSRRRCPQCASRITRIPRHPEDRIASRKTRVHRYRCRAPQGCGWEGTLPVMWVDTVAQRGYGTELPCVRRTRPAKSRFIFWILIALATIALGAGGVKLYDTFELRSLFADEAPIPLGVSDFGQPLPENHPFLQDS